MSVTEILELINNEDATIAGAVSTVLPRIAEFVERVVQSFRSGGRLIYVGAGTSGRLGVLDAAECPPTFSVAPDLVQGIIAGGAEALTRSVEGAEDSPGKGAESLEELELSGNDSVLGIATGGTTPFVQGALAYARGKGACTGFLVCTDEETVRGQADILIPVIVGPEVVTGSTRMKAGTATKLVLNMITTTAMVQLNKTYGNLMVDLKALNAKLWDRGTRIISEIAGLPYEEALGLLKRADGEVKTAFDACEVCHAAGKGYSQDGDSVICNNCGLKFRISELGEKNKGTGCWPAHLEHEIQENYILIKKTDVEAGSRFFS